MRLDFDGGPGNCGAVESRPDTSSPIVPGEQDRGFDLIEVLARRAGRAMTRRRPAAPWALLSYLLRYPERRAGRARADEVAALPPGEARAALERFTRRAARRPHAAARAYVETFDLRRRATLHLTYYEHGDTRRRGAALLRLKRLYREAGLRVRGRRAAGSPAVMLAFAALAPRRLRRRAARTAPARRSSSCAPGCTRPAARMRMCSTPSSPSLPPLRAEHRALADQVAQGAPEERVGVEPYVPAEVMPIP